MENRIEQRIHGELRKKAYNLKTTDRNNLLYGFVQDYFIEKENNIVFERENSESYSYAKGKLIGALTVLEYSLIETPLYIVIRSQSGNRDIVRYEL